MRPIFVSANFLRMPIGWLSGAFSGHRIVLLQALKSLRLIGGLTLRLSLLESDSHSDSSKIWVMTPPEHLDCATELLNWHRVNKTTVNEANKMQTSAMNLHSPAHSRLLIGRFVFLYDQSEYQTDLIESCRLGADGSIGSRRSEGSREPQEGHKSLICPSSRGARWVWLAADWLTWTRLLLHIFRQLDSHFGLSKQVKSQASQSFSSAASGHRKEAAKHAASWRHKRDPRDFPLSTVKLCERFSLSGWLLCGLSEPLSINLNDWSSIKASAEGSELLIGRPLSSSAKSCNSLAASPSVWQDTFRILVWPSVCLLFLLPARSPLVLASQLSHWDDTRAVLMQQVLMISLWTWQLQLNISAFCCSRLASPSSSRATDFKHRATNRIQTNKIQAAPLQKHATIPRPSESWQRKAI